MMELKDFIGKVVVSVHSGKRFMLSEITAPYITVKTACKNSSGYYETYRYECINGDPISQGILKFEDSVLMIPFNKAYERHCNSKDAYWENYGYWMSK